LKLGAYGILKLFVFRGSYVIFLKGELRGLRIIGIILIGFFMIRHLDIKVIVAYSSVVHMGLVFVCFFYGFEFGLLGGIFTLLSHGLCSSALFYILNLGYERQFSRRLILMRGGLVFSPVMSYW